MEYIASKIMIRKSPVPILPLSPMSRCAESERECFLDMDLAARNVLLGEDNLCKIADFGLVSGSESDTMQFKTDISLALDAKVES